MCALWQMDVWVYGCMGVWVCGCMVVWLYGIYEMNVRTAAEEKKRYLGRGEGGTLFIFHSCSLSV